MALLMPRCLGQSNELFPGPSLLLDHLDICPGLLEQGPVPGPGLNGKPPGPPPDASLVAEKREGKRLKCREVFL